MGRARMEDKWRHRPLIHKQQGNKEQAREYLTKALDIFARLGTLIESDKVRKELAELPTEH